MDKLEGLKEEHNVPHADLLRLADYSDHQTTSKIGFFVQQVGFKSEMCSYVKTNEVENLVGIIFSTF